MATPTNVKFLFFSSHTHGPLLRLFFYRKPSGTSGRNSLLSPFFLSDYSGFPKTHFFKGTTRLTSWPSRVCYSSLLQSLVVSLILPLVSTFLFSSKESVLSNMNSVIIKALRCPQKNLCFLVTLAVFSLVFAATVTAFCLTLIFLESAESRIFHAVPAVIQPRTPLISFCTVQLRTLYAARSLATLCLSAISGSVLGKFSGFRGSIFSRLDPISRKGSGNNKNFSTQ